MSYDSMDENQTTGKDKRNKRQTSKLQTMRGDDDEKDSLAAHGAYLGFEHIKLSIEVDHDDLDNMSGTTRKYILNDVSGEAFPSQLLGIIGASGGGKTTLLSLISGRLFRIESLASKSEVCH